MDTLGAEQNQYGSQSIAHENGQVQGRLQNPRGGGRGLVAGRAPGRAADPLAARRRPRASSLEPHVHPLALVALWGQQCCAEVAPSHSTGHESGNGGGTSTRMDFLKFASPAAPFMDAPYVAQSALQKFSHVPSLRRSYQFKGGIVTLKNCKLRRRNNAAPKLVTSP